MSHAVGAAALLAHLLLCSQELEKLFKGNLWGLFIIDVLIASFYNLSIYLEPINEYTNYLLIEIWIRPTIMYGLVACFVTEASKESK